MDTKADNLRRLHQAPPMLVLPNAWDVASARIFERAGFGALGTTSAGVAFVLGGMNLEDTTGADRLRDLAEQTGLIRAIRSATPKMVINARTDIFLNAIGEEATRFDRAVERLNAYRDAGADCLFAPGVRDRDTIARLVKAVRGPLNILAGPGSPAIPELQELGVARVSVGSGAMRATLGLVDRIAKELRERGSYTSMTEGAMAYAEVNRLLSAE